jgi:hypothetical protein
MSNDKQEHIMNLIDMLEDKEWFYGKEKSKCTTK